MTDERPLHVSPSTVRSLWQEYRIYRDRLEFDTHLGPMTIPFDEVESVRVSESDLRGLFHLMHGARGHDRGRAGSCSRVAAGDLTGDGFVDLAVPNHSDDHVAVLAGDGTGGFQHAGTILAPDGPVRIALTDLDFDGDLDLLVASREGAALRVGLSQLAP